MKPSKILFSLISLMVVGVLFAIYGYGQAANLQGTTVGAGAVSNGTVPGPSKLGVAGTSFTNLRHGISGAMTGGTVTVTDAGATANTRYFFTTHTLGTVVVCSTFYASTRTPGVSFAITANQPTDTSTVDWLAIEP